MTKATEPETCGICWCGVWRWSPGGLEINKDKQIKIMGWLDIKKAKEKYRSI